MHKLFPRVVSIFTILSLVIYPAQVYALPTDAEVAAGSGAATFAETATTFDVNQTTPKVIINYESFGIGNGETVTFNQPGASSIALNRVIGGEGGISPSQILGTLQANGRVFIVNPSGILFGAGSHVDTAGLLASTLDITDNAFLNPVNGQYSFTGAGGSVVNAGALNSPGGFIALLGSRIENSGAIMADLGSIALASGSAITVGLDAQNVISVVVDQPTGTDLDDATVTNTETGRIQANGGKVLLTAKSLSTLFTNAVNNNGIIEANTMSDTNGLVVLESNKDIYNAGGISATNVQISGDNVLLAGSINAEQDARVETVGNVTFYSDFRILSSAEWVTGQGWSTVIGYSDDVGTYFTLPFEFPFFGSSSSTVFVTTNGYLAPGFLYGPYYSTSYGYQLAGNNDALMTHRIVAANWSDWYDSVSVQTSPDRAVFQWSGAHCCTSGQLNMQMILNASGSVQFNYGAMNGGYAETTHYGESQGVSTGTGTYAIGPYSLWTPSLTSNSSVLWGGGSGVGAGQGITAGGNVTITAGGSIIDQNAGQDIQAPNAVLTAGGSIGGEGNAIDTNVDNLTAIANGGDVYINEANGVNLVDIQALGSTVDIESHGDTYIDNVLAEGNGSEDPAIVDIYVEGGDLIVDNGVVRAVNNGNGDAQVYLNADGPVETEETTDVGGAVDIRNNSDISAVVLNVMEPLEEVSEETVLEPSYGEAQVYLGANARGTGIMTISNSTVRASVSGNDVFGAEGNALVRIDAGSINLNAGIVSVENGGTGYAQADLVAWDGSILSSGNSLIGSDYVGLIARNDIGTVENPINTNTAHLAAYSFANGYVEEPAITTFSEIGDGEDVPPVMETGSIYINNIGTDLIELGYVVPASNYQPEYSLSLFEGSYEGMLAGASIAANNGVIGIKTAGDMVVNSIISPRGGVYLQSLQGSIYAGQGWIRNNQGHECEFNGSDYFDTISHNEELTFMDISDTAWYDYVDYFSAVSFGYDYELSGGPNVIAGGASYFSAPNGTIGVGYPGDEYSGISGQIQGVVNPGTTAVTGVNPSPDLDISEGTPPGTVYFEDLTVVDEGDYVPEETVEYFVEVPVESVPSVGQAIWPVPGSLSPMNNPLNVNIRVLEGAPSMIPESAVPAFGGPVGLMLQFGAQPGGGDPSQLANLLAGNFRKYYEILDGYRYVPIDPARPLGFFAYHPLTETDTSAYDGFNLDEGAYDFIDGNLAYNGDFEPGFGGKKKK